MVKAEKSGDAIGKALVLLLCAATMLSLLVSHLRMGRDGAPPRAEMHPSGGVARKWLENASAGNPGLATACAAKIADDSFHALPNPDCLDLVRLSGLSTALISGPFSEIDSSRWTASFRSAEIARAILAGCGGEDGFPSGLLSWMEKDFKIAERRGAADDEGFLDAVIARKEASPEAALRLASEISLQAGFEPMVVTLHGKDQAALGAMLEIGKGGRMHLLSFASKKLWTDTSVRKLLGDSADTRIEGFPENAKFARYHLPAEPSDFKTANADLRRTLIELHPGAGIPLFGVSPLSRMQNAVRRRAPEGVPPSMFAYWHYPFTALRGDKGLPAIFHLDGTGNR